MSKGFQNTFSYKLIYVFKIPGEVHKDVIKVGEATVTNFKSVNDLDDNSETLNQAAFARINSYTRTAGISYELFYTTLATTKTNTPFRDLDVHDVLKRSGISQPRSDLNGATEWFKCDLETVKRAILAVKEGRKSLNPGELSTGQTPVIFRPEQKEAIAQTLKQFRKGLLEKETNEHMLWNAKMRFGKTLSALEVTKQMSFSKTLIVTHRPVVKVSWFDDFEKIFFDQPDYLYGSKTQGETLSNLNLYFDEKGKKFVYFASIQDLRGSSYVGGKFSKNDELFSTSWDFVIVDEAHEGTQTTLGNEVIQTVIKSTSKTKTLYLSGTPFNLLSPISKQTFKEEEVYTWDYVMEQRAKLEWVEKHFGDHNPYEGLPKLSIYTYDLANIITNQNYKDIEDTAFNFKEFFRVWTGNAEIDKAKQAIDVKVGSFVYEKDVKRFLDMLVEYGEHNYPFSTNEYRDNFRHTLWMLPGVKEAKALSLLLKSHDVFKHFEIVNVAGPGDEEVKNDDALKLVTAAISENPQETRTITISCGRLTTGVTVQAWTAVFMLSGSSATSASSYLQTIFRVQTPANIGGKIKTNCYVFDFAPDRTLKMVAEAGNISVKKGAINDDKQKMREFLNFCPVIGIHGSEMRPYSTENMLVQLKKALVDKVARNGFDDRHLYNDKLLQLSELEIEKFNQLKGILKITKTAKGDDDILINDQGLDNEQREAAEKKNKKQLSEADKKRLEEHKKKLKERSNAISILRGIAIRIPLLVYGADIDINRKIDVDSFTSLIDDNSWNEFMPKGVTKDTFKEFGKYFDNEIFVEAGLKIRRQAKAADELPPLERVYAIANIFSTFKNPDRETVLTPWRAVNMHLGECIGGANFYEEDYERVINISEDTTVRWINKKLGNYEIFSTSSKILDINSKTGLYPLYCAISIYQGVKFRGQIKNVENLWKDILNNNIFVICRTKMAAAITRRTLKGFMSNEEYKTNILVIESIVDQMNMQYKENYGPLVNLIQKGRSWKKENENMKFNVVVGNPPYQSDAKQQIYADFYLLSRELGDVVSLIFPIGWQEPKTANNLSKLNTEEIKRDRQIIHIDNRQNIFPGIAGAEWTNFILWKKGFDNKLNGMQLILNNGEYEDARLLPIIKDEIEKPHEIVELSKYVINNSNFESMANLVSSLKPYGLRTDFFDDPKKYNLPPLQLEKSKNDDIKIYGIYKKKQTVMFVPSDYPIPKKTKSFNAYKVFVGKAWGNWSDNYLGGAYSDIIVAKPLEICTENFLEIGTFSKFEESNKMAKYLLTRFARALLYLNKYSQDNSKDKFNAIPLQDFREAWWEESIENIEIHLFEKYRVPQHIREFVLKNIQKKTEMNILFKK